MTLALPAALALPACGDSAPPPSPATQTETPAAPPRAEAARRIVVLDAPSNLGLRPPAPGKLPGVYRLPEALRRNRIVERLGASDGGSVPVPPYSPDADKAVGFRNGTSLSRYTRVLAGRIEEQIREGKFVVVLGGDCSVLLGGMLGLRRLGAYGLAAIDAHDDYSYIRDRKRYEGIFTAAGLDLALVTGHGPDALSNLDGLRPYVPEKHAVQLGLSREPGDDVYFATETFDRSGIRSLRRSRIQEIGASRAGREARAYLESKPIEGFFVHVDADVLDASLLPAVDSPNPEGLTFQQLTELLTELLRSPKMVGLDLAILDPDLDPEGVYAARFTDAIVEAFERAAKAPEGAVPP